MPIKRGHMLSQFTEEVLSNGPVALLPQNMKTKWLKHVQKQCDDFLDRNFSENECRIPEDIKEDLLIACVMEILYYGRGKTSQPDLEEVIKAATIYALCITMESVQRESGIEFEPPDLENILDIGRIAKFKENNPEFIEFIEKACIIRNDNSGWLQSLKNKVFSAVLGD